ncbi:MAG: outer membrane beta-barrel protein [Paracoccaceae bacterium]
MKHFISAVAVVMASSTLAVAGGPITPYVEPQPMQPAAVAVHDWSGVYVGLGYGKASADVVFTPGGAVDFNDGTITSLHAGYLLQRGSLVYGGELSFGSISDLYAIPGFGNNDEIDRVIDLKARLGFAADRFQLYGVLGYSKATYTEVPGGDWDADGMAYGIGAEYAVSQRMTIGVEYLARDLSADSPTLVGQTADFNLDTVSLRVGLQF